MRRGPISDSISPRALDTILPGEPFYSLLNQQAGLRESLGIRVGFAVFDVTACGSAPRGQYTRWQNRIGTPSRTNLKAAIKITRLSYCALAAAALPA
jgi:hypothetical protein